jgi:protein-tyrosine phosphatase
MKSFPRAAVVLAPALAFAALAASAPAASAHPAKTPHAQHIPFTAATVTAQPDGSFTIAWNAPGVRRVVIRAEGKTVASGGGRGEAVVRGLRAADRQWFDLEPDHGGSLRLADRLIKLDGTVNFRDAGGYRTADGRWVKMGEIYRSDALDKLTDADRAKLRRLGIKTVFDLRQTTERTAAPDRLPAGTDYVVADVLAGGGGIFAMPKTAEEAARMLVDGERFMVSGATAKAAYTTVFRGIGTDSAHGVVFHCTAGKDRTGWSEAALLTALGVPRDTVMADYLASNDYRAAANQAALDHMPPAQAAVYKPLLDVRPEYLNAGFEEVRKQYGSFDSYLKRALDLDARDVRELKNNLLVG